MDKKHEAENAAEYRIGDIKYTVTPVFGEAPKKESIEDKIMRLILQEKTQKGAKP